MLPAFGVQPWLLGAEAPFRVLQGSLDDAIQFPLGEGVEPKDLDPGEQGSDDLEGRIFRGGADEGDHPFLDVGEKGILLRLVESMNLVDEEDGPPPFPLLKPRRVFDHLFDLLDADRDGGEGDEGGPNPLGDQIRESGLARAGGPPEDYRWDLPAIEGEAEHPALVQQVRLPHELLQRFRPHPIRERCLTLAVSLFRLFKQLHRST